VIINWIKNNIFPLIEIEGWVINIFKRLDKLEKDSHPPLFEKDQLNKLHKRVEDLETVAFVKKFGNKMKHYEGTD
tara:strand:+ start:1238 stop:1462 length:225 start_codon:yes stop_codon:yes gene_type:complete